jgi:hypothetical protein
MHTDTHPAPAKTKRPEGREFYAVNFDLREFRQKHPQIRRGMLSERLGLSTQSLDNYDKRAPLSVYKAIIEAFASEEAHNYELKLLVEHNNRPFYITNQTQELAKAYDKRRAGQKITLADGTGYYQIAPEQATEDVPLHMHDREVPVGIETPLSSEEEKIAGFISPAPISPTNEETAILLQQQEALIAVLARVAKDRDEAAIQLQQNKQTLADRDATIANLSGQVARLKDSVREWEELSRMEPLRGTPATANATLIADEIVARLRGTLTASGHPALIKELERVSPKRTGYGSFPQPSGRNGNSRNSR